MKTLVSQTAVTGFADIEIPGIAGHLETRSGSAHLAEQIVDRDPVTRWTTPQRLLDGGAAPGDGGQPPFALASLALDAVDAPQLVEQRGFQPALPQLRQRLFHRLAQSLLPGLGQLQRLAAQRRQPAGLRQHRPGKRFDRADLLVLAVPAVVVEISAQQQRVEGP